MRNMKKEALILANKGFRVIPCKEKRPAINSWQKIATNNNKSIEKLWQNENYNIAILTGQKGGNFIVIDCDIKEAINGLDNFINYLKENDIELPTTLTATSGGGGKHYYFKTKAPIKNSVSKYIEGVDIRADDGCIIAPPSLHPNGNEYKWDNDFPMAELPKKLEELFLTIKKQKKEITKKVVKTKYEDTIVINMGNRNNTLFKLASRLIETGLSNDSILKAIINENESKCEEPLPLIEIQELVNSTLKYRNTIDINNSSENNIFNGNYNTTSISIYWLIWYLSLYRSHNKIYISQNEMCLMLNLKTTKAIRENIKPLIKNDLIRCERVMKIGGGYGVYSYEIL